MQGAEDAPDQLSIIRPLLQLDEGRLQVGQQLAGLLLERLAMVV
jgi:hypothetical protein